MDQIIIEADKKGLNLNLKEVFAYKDLLYTLAARDFKVRYSQTFLGVLWAIIQPLFTLIVFTLVFGKAVKVDTGNIPYPLFALAGMCAWNYFSNVMSQAGNSIIQAQSMVQKIYFPRLIIPLSKALVGLIDMGIIFLFFFMMFIYYGFSPSLNIIFLPFFIFINMIASLAIGIWLSALTIRFRDFQIIVPFLVQFGLYATPIAYSTNLIPEEYRLLFYLNPMTGVVEGFRWCLIGTSPPNNLAFVSFVVVIFLFISSLFYFRRTERVMADIV